MVDGGVAEEDVQAFGWGSKACAKAMSVGRCGLTPYGEISATMRNTR